MYTYRHIETQAQAKRYTDTERHIHGYRHRETYT